MQEMRRRVIILSLALTAVAPASAVADFCLLTQNGLHLGQGEATYRAAKRDGFRRIFSGYDVVALQEVMDPDEPGRLAPDGFAVAVSAAKGASTYREHYAVLVRQAAARLLDAADYPDVAAFARPPFAVALEDRDGGRFWLVDIHAVFGKGGLAPRRAEVAAMAPVLAYFAARPLPDGGRIDRVVVVGDWNLSAADRAFGQLAGDQPGVTVAPDLRTSLNAQGAYSSAYDHFLWNGAMLSVDFAAEPRELGGLDPAVYRRTLSDHVGVAGYVMDQPGERRPPEVACPPLPASGEAR